MPVQTVVPIKVKAPDDMKVAFYVFEATGKFIAKSVVKDSQTDLTLPEAVNEISLRVGPDLDVTGEKAEQNLRTVRTLYPELKYPPEAVGGIDLGSLTELVPPLYLTIKVQGSVVHPVTIQGIRLQLPVPNALVTMSEVDIKIIGPHKVAVSQPMQHTHTAADGTFAFTILWSRIQPLPNLDLLPDLRFTVSLDHNGSEVQVYQSEPFWDVTPPNFSVKLVI